MNTEALQECSDVLAGTDALTWLVFGSKGWIGNQVMDILMERCNQYGDKVYEANEVRADDEAGVSQLLDTLKPDRVISLVGRTHGPGFTTIDYLEQKGKLRENLRDNLWSPFVLAHLCDMKGIHLTHMNTGCIFTYDEKHTTTEGFTEEDEANFFGSAYSTVKGYTERILKMLGGQTLIVRIRMPITADYHPRNFITKILSYSKVCSVPNSMTVLPELLPVMVDMAVRKLVGVMNLTNPGVISHNEMLEMYKYIVDPSFTWDNFTIEEQNKILLSERSNNYLDTTRLEAHYPQVKPIKDSVREVLMEIKKKNLQRQ